MGCSGWRGIVGLMNQDIASPGVRGFVSGFEINGGDVDLLDYEKGGLLASAGLPTQYYLTGSGDRRTMTAAILGGGPPLAIGNGDLYRLFLRGAADNTPHGSDGLMVEALVRDPDNTPIPVVGMRNARINVDCAPPEVALRGLAVTGNRWLVVGNPPGRELLALDLEAIEAQALAMSARGLRVLALAKRAWEESGRLDPAHLDGKLTFIGLLNS